MAKSTPPPSSSSTTATPNATDVEPQADSPRPLAAKATTLPGHERDEDFWRERDLLDERVSVGRPKAVAAAPPPVGVPLKQVVAGPPLVGSTKAATTTPLSVAPLAAPPVKARKTKKKAQKGDQEKERLIEDLAAAIEATDDFAKDAGGRLYRCRNGVYRPDGRNRVKQRVKAILKAADKPWFSRLAGEVAEYIRIDAQALWEQPPRDTINVANGLVDLATGKLRPHSPEYLSPVQLPVVFDPEATCPEWDQFAADVFPPDAVEVAFELPAKLMVPGEEIDKAEILLGGGANGKSTYLEALRIFLGRRNVSAISLHRLESDRFSVARLAGKLANICADIPSTHLENTSVFKSITGGDEVTGEFKFKDSFEFTPFCRLVFSANHLPRSADASHAFFRRWRVVRFDRTFEGHACIPRPELDARLRAPRELSGVLNRCLAVLPAVRQRGVLESASMKEAWTEFRATTDPLAIWLDKALRVSPDGYVPKGDLRSDYNRAAEAEGRPVLTEKAFGQAFNRLRPGIEDAQRTVNGQVRWVYLGLELTEATHALHAVHSVSST